MEPTADLSNIYLYTLYNLYNKRLALTLICYNMLFQMFMFSKQEVC